MNARLYILNLEDNPYDAELIQNRLDEDGIQCEVLRVDAKEDYISALEKGNIDVILSDYSLPDFDGLSALELAVEKCPDTPFIFVSGVIGEDLAIDTLKKGATDYVLKTGLQRLAPAVRRAVDEAKEHSDRKKAEEELRKAHAELERRVEERTAELSQLTLSLQNEISERRRAEAALRQYTYDLEHAYKDLENLSYAVSHDLQAPVRRIIGFSSIFSSRYGEKLDEEGVALLKRILANVEDMKNLIQDLLNYSRLGTRAVNRSQINIAALVREAYEEARPAEGEREIEIKIAVLPPAYGDPDLIHQVFLNLLSNALKFTRKRKTSIIEVGGTPGADETIFYVRDNGIGFDMQFQQKLFGLFQRIHSEKEFEGTGVGLVIVKKIIEKHGGRVWAEGKENEGSTFYFALPVQNASTPQK